ncbi:hypothetical protein HQ585_01935 [candidate division KSB1 bacterium]|nr:hypothetical protein [candidate division KSB1 bacterium]
MVIKDARPQPIKKKEQKLLKAKYKNTKAMPPQTLFPIFPQTDPRKTEAVKLFLEV